VVKVGTAHQIELAEIYLLNTQSQILINQNWSIENNRMANIKVIDLVLNSTVEADLLSNSDSFVRDLFESELVLQGGKKRRRPAPSIAVVPDILIGFSVGFSI
jgi:hypothetical protein